MQNQKSSVVLVLAILVATALSHSAMAYKFPGDDPAIGGAVAAKIIGQFCSGTLSETESKEIDAYLAKASIEWTKNEERQKNKGYSSPSAQDLIRMLSETYSNKYKSPSACDDGAKEEARDILEKVRKVMAAGGPTYPDETDPTYRPHVGAAISAKVTGEKCKGTITALERAGLEFFVARSWLLRARSASDIDAQHEMDLLKSAERDMSNGWRTADCTPQAITKAKSVAAHITKDLAGVTP
ncbi:MAG: hypothetical protein ABL901_04320 [Hyphomicrobiaceae bacterium]